MSLDSGLFFGYFVGGVALDKEPFGFAVHLISLTTSSETSDRGGRLFSRVLYSLVRIAF